MPRGPLAHPAVPFLALCMGVATVSCDDGIALSNIEVQLQIDSSNVDFGNVQVGAQASQVVLLRNAGDADLILEGARRGDVFDESFTYTLDRLSIPPNGVSRLSMHFAPEGLGEKTAHLIIRSADPRVADATIAIRGTGVSTTLLVAPESLSFGHVLINTTKRLRITLSNQADVDASIALIEGENVRRCTARDDDPSTFCLRLSDRTISPDGRFSLRAGQSIILEVQFAPVVTAPQERGHFTLSACDNSACDTEVRLDGVSIEQGLRCDPPNLDFARVNPGACLSKTVACENIANEPITIIGWGPSGADPATSRNFTFEPSHAVVLNEGDTFGLDVTYCPDGLSNDEGYLQIETERAAPHRFMLVALSGAGGGPDIEVLPAQCNFGLVSLIAPSVCTVRVANVGFDDLEISSITADTAAFTAPGSGATVIAPGESQRITVEFLPFVEGPIESTLRIISNDRDEPETEVRLRGEGINLPPCSFEVSPDRLSFGEVPVQRFQGGAFEIRNVGHNDCLLTSVRLEPGSDRGISLPDAGVRSEIIAPGSAFTVRIDFAPTVAGQPSGAVLFSISSARSPFNRVPISGTATQAALLIVPNEIDFGTIGVGRTTPARTVQIYNTSSTPAIIRSIQQAAPRNPAFTVTQRPPEVPASIPPGQSAEFSVSFHADALSHYAGAVEIFGTFDGNPVTYVVSMQGRSSLAARQEERFEQLSARKVDVLFVVDFSGSMAQEQIAMAANFSEFLRFAEAQALDYQIGVTTRIVNAGGRLFHTDQVRGNGFNGPLADRFVTPASTPDPNTVFGRNVQAVNLFSGLLDVGDLYASYLALTPPATAGHNAGFLRPDALLSVIYVSDEPEYSHLLADVPGRDIDFYVDFLRSVKGFRNTNLMSASAIVGDAPDGCEGPGGSAVAGPRYAELAYRTGGTVHSICTNDWSGTLQALSRTAFGLRSRFFLSNPPDISTLVVLVDGVQVPATSMSGTVNWSHDPTTNAVEFSAWAVPEPGAQIIVRYTTRTL